MNEKRKHEFALQYNPQKNNDIYNKLYYFKALEEYEHKDIAEIDLFTILKWYINTSKKHTYNAIKPIKSYVFKYQQWSHEQYNTKKPNNLTKDETIKIKELIIESYKSSCIRNYDELIDILKKVFPISIDNELSTNHSIQTLFCLVYAGIKISDVYEMTIDDMTTDYSKVYISYKQYNIVIDHPYVVNLLIKTKNIRVFNRTLIRRNNSKSVTIKELNNKYIINTNINKERTLQNIQKSVFEASRNSDIFISLTDMEKYGIINAINQYINKNNLEIQVTLSYHKEFTHIYSILFPFNNEVEKTRFRQGILIDLIMIYLAW